MASDTVTLAAGGEVSLGDFARLVDGLQKLLAALGSEVAPGSKIEWIVDYLDAGSATVLNRARSSDVEAIGRVIRAYVATGRSLEEGRPIPYSNKVRKPADSIVSILNSRITSIRFETSEEEAVVVSASAKVDAPRYRQAYGAVEGRVQTLTSRGALRFALYDYVYGRAVTCYLSEGQEEMMRGVWDKRAVVEGWVSRDPVTGRPMSVRHVTSVDIRSEVPPGSYRAARGAVPHQPGDPSPEDIIRRLRDAV